MSRAVEQLREARDTTDAGWALLSASDPLNLSGIIGAGPRVPSNHRNALVLRDGHFVALKQAGQIEFLGACTEEELREMRRSLQTGRREPLPVTPFDWSTRPIAAGNRSRSWSR